LIQNNYLTEIHIDNMAAKTSLVDS